MPRLTHRLLASLLAGALGGLLALAVLPAPAAYAAARVSIDAQGQGAVIDGTYSTTLRLSGQGFQSIKGGHGGIYVWFGTVSKGWQPSKGGVSGTDYAYVPDSETKNNAGFQRYVAFPGSDTASSAAAVMNAAGGWSVSLTVPGPSFQAVGRDGGVRSVDCRKVTCGVITVGAHGVTNGNNETFTPVRVGDLGGTPNAPTTPADTDPAAPESTDAATTAPETSTGPGEKTGKQPSAKADKRPAVLKVDRRSAVAGRALAWSVRHLAPGRQFSLVLDDGLAASGPHAVGADGRATGVLELPAEITPGTHEVRIFGAGKAASVRFGLTGDQVAPVSAEVEDPARVSGAAAFALTGAVIFGLALLVALRRFLRGRHAAA